MDLSDACFLQAVETPPAGLLEAMQEQQRISAELLCDQHIRVCLFNVYKELKDLMSYFPQFGGNGEAMITPRYNEMILEMNSWLSNAEESVRGNAKREEVFGAYCVQTRLIVDQLMSMAGMAKKSS
jgi:hypothetical protein